MFFKSPIVALRATHLYQNESWVPPWAQTKFESALTLGGTASWHNGFWEVTGSFSFWVHFALSPDPRGHRKDFSEMAQVSWQHICKVFNVDKSDEALHILAFAWANGKSSFSLYMKFEALS